MWDFTVICFSLVLDLHVRSYQLLALQSFFICFIAVRLHFVMSVTRSTLYTPKITKDTSGVMDCPSGIVCIGVWRINALISKSVR